MQQKNEHQDENANTEPGFAAQLREDLPAADLRYVLQIFADDLARLTGEVTAAARHGNAMQRRRTAHALAGAAAAVGASLLEAACRDAQADTSAAAGQLFAHSTAIEAAAANTSQTLQRLYPPMDRPTPAGTAPAGAKV